MSQPESEARFKGIAEEATKRYPINGRFSDEGRDLFVKGMAEILFRAEELYKGHFRNRPADKWILEELDQPYGENEHQMVTAFKERLYSLPISPTVSGTKNMVDSSITHVFGDSMEMMARGVRTWEELKKAKRGRPSYKWREGRQFTSSETGGSETVVTTLRRAPDTYVGRPKM